jgi:hypothetical protein
MKLKSLLTIGGCSILLVSTLLSGAASAAPLCCLDPELLSGGRSNNKVYHLNAPPQPAQPGRQRYLPPQPPGVYSLNAPSQTSKLRAVQRCRICS